MLLTFKYSGQMCPSMMWCSMYSSPSHSKCMCCRKASTKTMCAPYGQTSRQLSIQNVINATRLQTLLRSPVEHRLHSSWNAYPSRNDIVLLKANFNLIIRLEKSSRFMTKQEFINQSGITMLVSSQTKRHQITENATENLNQSTSGNRKGSAITECRKYDVLLYTNLLGRTLLSSKRFTESTFGLLLKTQVDNISKCCLAR